ncbi:hypothetical protein A5630_04575 [Mycolicibacterium mucogenicum]|uniref:Uncharacterized protein n=1 Tax=Mycolicibacterium mucogenicum TaxID=56689 RepID=A0A1A3GPZ8_MYCMU|nr:hypothetical protein [Mycolicibacterium mucogenicum]OBJ37418.1 hypothetical protein A5630_04575 [Mycolicibacterium mucogenicum]
MELDQHFSVFRPYNRDPRHEDQLTRAALIVLMLVPLAHEAFLGLIGKGRLATMPSPRYDMQTENLTPLSSESGEQEVEEFVSVLLGPHEFLKNVSTVEVSERRARYDGVVQYGPRLLVAIESKLVTGLGEKQATEINPKGLVWGHSEIQLVKWHELLDQWWNLLALGVLNPTEAIVLNDFFDFAESNFGDLLPFTALGRCRANPRRRLRRLCSILSEASGIPGESIGGRAAIKFPDQVVSIDRSCLWINGDDVNLGVWPGELATQYNRLYGTPKIVENLLALADQEGWCVSPNFHLGYRFSRPAQRWYPGRNIEGKQYVQQWVDDLNDGHAGGRTHEQLDDAFHKWLVGRGYATVEELPNLMKWLADHPNVQIHIRPGVEILRTWPLSEAIALDDSGDLVLAVRDTLDQVLGALNEIPLASTATTKKHE